MRDRLPSIHIKVADAARFVDEFARIAETLNSLTVIRRAGDNYPVSLRCDDDPPHKGCSVHLMIETSTKIHVAVSISGDDFSYENYCAVAKTIIAMPLAIYNRNEHKRYRMTVMSKERLQPKLKGTSAKLFNRFTETANKSHLHLSDWWVFYEFVHACRTKLSADDLAFLLVKEGFSDEYAYHIVSIYEHLRAFSRKRTEAETHKFYNITMGWKGPPSGT